MGVSIVFHISALLLTLVFPVLALRIQPLSLLAQHQSEEEEQCGPKLSIETPKCSVTEKRKGYELRQYPDGQMWAETLVPNASYSEAARTGFFRCFDFISGKNSRNEKILMTAPVLIKPIPEENGFKIAFFVPSRFKTLDDVPNPSDPNVKITMAGGGVHAVFGPFGGFADGVMYEKKWEMLKGSLERDGVNFIDGTVTYAGYSSPFQFLNRKQEVHVMIVPVSSI